MKMKVKVNTITIYIVKSGLNETFRGSALQGRTINWGNC